MKGTHWFIIGLIAAFAAYIAYQRGYIKLPATTQQPQGY